MATVRQVEALVAERKVRDLLPAERDREAHPVVEGRIHDLVARQAPATVGHGHVTDLSAPSFDEPDHQPVRPSAARVGPSGSTVSCSLTNAADRWISSHRTYARAKTSPVCHVDSGTCEKRKRPE